MINPSFIKKLDLSLAQDQTKLAAKVESAFKDTHSYIISLAKTWDTNIRFYEGDQWIYYDETIQSNVQIPIIEGKTDFIPRPVTNYLPSILWTIASIFTKNKPTAMVFPNSDDDSDISAAKVAEAILDTKWELDKEQQMHVDAILTALLCGNAIRKDFWNPSLSPVSIPSPDGGVQQMNLGDTDVQILSPFEVYPDLYGGQYYMQASVTPIEEIVGMYNFEGNNYTGKALDVKPSKAYSSVLQLRENLRTLSRNRYGTRSGSDTSEDQDTAVLVEIYIKPNEAYPNGIMFVEANGIPLYVSESPYYDPKVEDSWHPYTWFKWMKSPLKFHGLSLVEHLVPLQRRINGIDSIIQLHNMTMINPVWMNPKSCQVPKGFFNGRPGLVIDYNDGPNTTPPQRLPGVPLGADIYEERKRKVEDLHTIAGDNLVLQGNQPSGVNTATGLQLLMEQSSTKFNPYYTDWEKFIEHGQQKKLLMIAKFYVENRPDFVETIKKMSKKPLNTEIESFIGADLRDNIQVRIEAGSSIPRSKLVEQQQLLDLANMGVLGDITPANPVANAEFLQKFGVRQFEGVTNPDLVKANYVVSVLRQINENKLSEDNYPPLMPVDNIDIHMEMLVKEMKKPEFSDPKQVFQAKFQELMEAKEIQQMQEPVVSQEGDMAQGEIPQPPEGQEPATPEELAQLGIE